MFDFPEHRFIVFQFGISLLGGFLIALIFGMLSSFFVPSVGFTSLIIGFLVFFVLFIVSSFVLNLLSARWFKLNGSWKHSLIATFLFLPFFLTRLFQFFILLLPLVELSGFYYKKST